MKIAAVCTAYHEQDILPWSIKHLLREGVDEIWIKSPTGDSYDIFDPRVKFLQDDEKFHDQANDINHLAKLAEADWIIPFDADEFFYSAQTEKTIRQTLESMPDEVGVILVLMFQQHDWWWKEKDIKPLPKVVYRWHPEAKVAYGNHYVEHPGKVWRYQLHLREIQYRDFDHFQRKIFERMKTIDSVHGPEQGGHIKALAKLSPDELQDAWDSYIQLPSLIWDPVVTRLTLPAYRDELYSMESLRERMAQTPCDIAGHLQRLHDIVLECNAETVVECGVNTGMSTIAFLSTGAEVHSCDIIVPRVRPEVRSHPLWHFNLCSDLDWNPPPAQVYFIDTSHTHAQTLAELAKYWPLVPEKGCMIFHDTHGQFDGEQGRAIKHWLHTLKVLPRKIEDYLHDEGLTVFWK